VYPDYETTDLGVIAFLTLRGHVIRAINGHAGQQRVFVFPPEAATDADAYERGASAPAKRLVQAIKDAKRMVFNHSTIGNSTDDRRRR
jgi:hypothetical protein